MEELYNPPRGTFIPWSIGPRSCPGQKMSQLEFVTVIATLFRRCKASPKLKDGEDIEEARRRLLGCMEDSQAGLTLQMTKPQDVDIRWERRAVL